jgi:L-amino acid N-acyltransferase YncA
MIRLAKFEDLEGIVEIFNEAINARFQTAFMEPVTVNDRIGWFNQHTPSEYPLFVYEMDHKIVGWTSISPYRAGRPALRHTVEISYFVHTGQLKKGIGTQLVQHALNASRLLHYRTVLAIIIDKNIASAHLLKKFGFEKWGHLPNVAEFDGVVCSHEYYGKSLLPL